ncbi:hypothetical protein VA249_45340 (plasmid) [Vibrio alfacsensis]|uniref:hypothetical protein n=1 Tax=Vibrio alfacsensis TaxID=1074311 RepID=UPI001BF0AF16|nr:hypothetical protein [Vibrio alfacsensis]BBM67888.1 hypothetical protein VA249_45340 [Vibrio alfacsensis]
MSYYLIVFLWFVAQVKISSDWFNMNRLTISKHVTNLGVAGYTGAYVYAIQTGFDWKMILLLVSGVMFTLIAEKMAK